MAKNKISIAALFKQGEDVIGYFDLKNRALAAGYSEVQFHNMRISAIREQDITEVPAQEGYIYFLHVRKTQFVGEECGCCMECLEAANCRHHKTATQ